MARLNFFEEKKNQKNEKNQKMENFGKNVKNAPTLTLNIWVNRFPDLAGLGGVSTGWPWAFIRNFVHPNPPTNGQENAQKLKKMAKKGKKWPKFEKRPNFDIEYLVNQMLDIDDAGAKRSVWTRAIIRNFVHPNPPRNG